MFTCDYCQTETKTVCLPSIKLHLGIAIGSVIADLPEGENSQQIFEII
jgi:hypothetical protein